MTGYQWFTLIQAVVMGLAAAGVALIYRGFQTGKWVQDQESRKQEIELIHRRLDKAGLKMSDLANEIQKFPDEMRDEFVSKEVFEIHQAVAKERIGELRVEFRKEDTLIWEEVRRLKGNNRR